jgi:hypothetical protein
MIDYETRMPIAVLSVRRILGPSFTMLIANGTEALPSIPCCPLRMASRPPKCSRRDRIPGIPTPGVAVFSEPTLRRAACLCTFASASCTTRKSERCNSNGSPLSVPVPAQGDGKPGARPDSKRRMVRVSAPSSHLQRSWRGGPRSSRAHERSTCDTPR